MSRWRMAFLLLSSALVLDGCSSVSKLKNVFGGSSYQLPSFKEVQLKNGLKVLLIPDDRLPSFSLQLLVKSGSGSDPAELPGVTSLMAQMMDQGTVHRPASDIADSIGRMGAEFNRVVSKDFMMFGIAGLAQHHTELTKNFFEIITDPSFSDQELKRMRSRLISSRQHILDEAEGFSNQAFDRFLFGGGHPYGWPTEGTLASLKKINRKQIIRQYLNTVRPNNSLLAVVGVFDDKILGQIEELTKGWAPREVKPSELPAFPEIKGRNILLIKKPDLKQAQIRFGHAGIARTDADFLALRVANAVLGVSFESRLHVEVREKRGLTYNIRSDFDAKKGQGSFEIQTFTRLDKIGEITKVTLQVLEDLKAKGVTAEELASVKSFLKGLFPQVLETPESLARNLLILRFYDISDSYLTNYVQSLDRLSLSQINAAITKHIHPSDIKIQVFAPQAVAESQLKELGTVEVKDAKEFL